MTITPIKIAALTANQMTIDTLLGHYISNLSESSIVVVTSKIIALCEGSVADMNTSKEALVHQEADAYLPKNANAYGYQLTIKNHTLIASAGIDESNANGQYVLWPRDPQTSANMIREYLCETHGVAEIGVLITDSTSRPLRRGTCGIALAHSGFAALRDYRNTHDLFGKTLHSSVANIAEGLAAAAVVTMGEGDESTPIAVIEDLPHITFQPRNPTDQELEMYQMRIEDDVFAPLLTSVAWQQKK